MDFRHPIHSARAGSMRRPGPGSFSKRSRLPSCRCRKTLHAWSAMRLLSLLLALITSAAWPCALSSQVLSGTTITGPTWFDFRAHARGYVLGGQFAVAVTPVLQLEPGVGWFQHYEQTTFMGQPA